MVSTTLTTGRCCQQFEKLLWNTSKKGEPGDVIYTIFVDKESYKAIADKLEEINGSKVKKAKLRLDKDSKKAEKALKKRLYVRPLLSLLRRTCVCADRVCMVFE